VNSAGRNVGRREGERDNESKGGWDRGQMERGREDGLMDGREDVGEGGRQRERRYICRTRMKCHGRVTIEKQRPDCQSPSSLSLTFPPSFSIPSALALDAWRFRLRLSLDHTFLLGEAAFECQSVSRDVIAGGKVWVQGDQRATTSVTTLTLALTLILHRYRCIHHLGEKMWKAYSPQRRRRRQ